MAAKRAQMQKNKKKKRRRIASKTNQLSFLSNLEPYLQGPVVERLCLVVKLFVIVQSSQVVKGWSHIWVIWSQDGLSHLQGPLEVRLRHTGSEDSLIQSLDSFTCSSPIYHKEYLFLKIRHAAFLTNARKSLISTKVSMLIQYPNKHRKN